jgi:N-acetylglucosamine kinase-like BadF-type ATPase
VDAGGTTTRAVALAADGTVLGRGHAGGGNPNSHPPVCAAAAVRCAVAEAVRGLEQATGVPCVVGMAGHSKLTDPEVAAVFDRTWEALGVRARVVPDAAAAFASATAEPDGTVLVAGTGSIAGRIRERELVSTVGGYGWLLGDEGSGFWIGRQAVRTALDALAAEPARGQLVRAVLAEAGVDPAAPRAAHRLITAVNAESPVRLARFAPLVSTAQADGDPAAVAIVDQAARLLRDTALAARDAGEWTPLVLAGSVLAPDCPVGDHVRALLADLPVLDSGDGVLGAAWLASRKAFGDTTTHPRASPQQG